MRNEAKDGEETSKCELNILQADRGRTKWVKAVAMALAFAGGSAAVAILLRVIADTVG